MLNLTENTSIILFPPRYLKLYMNIHDVGQREVEEKHLEKFQAKIGDLGS